MKPHVPSSSKLRDWLRCAFYQTLPIFCLLTLWATAWARSLEATVRRDLEWREREPETEAPETIAASRPPGSQISFVDQTR